MRLLSVVPSSLCVLIALEGQTGRIDQARNVGLATLGLDDLDQLVVGCWVELNQNLADDADAWLLAVIDHEASCQTTMVRWHCL